VKLVPENQTEKALDFAANKNLVTDPELSNYRFVHLATHTILKSSTPARYSFAYSFTNRVFTSQKKVFDGLSRSNKN
jgi:CHAT domain-containing protein